jgi:hypothetical protein
MGPSIFVCSVFITLLQVSLDRILTTMNFDHIVVTMIVDTTVAFDAIAAFVIPLIVIARDVA